MKLKRGLIHVYTGEGKGKSTAALGQAFRSAGAGLKVLVVQFFKPFPSGERNVGDLSGLGPVFRVLKAKHPFFNPKSSPQGIAREISLALTRLEKEMARDRWDLVVLDEINNALAGGFLPWPRFAAFLKLKPAAVEIVCTGRGAPKKLLRLADYATEMRKLKHPFDKKIAARRGIEY